MEWLTAENLASLGAIVVAIASILSSVLPDDSGIMRFVNILAINVGKAKNDPGSQSSQS